MRTNRELKPQRKGNFGNWDKLEIYRKGKKVPGPLKNSFFTRTRSVLEYPILLIKAAATGLYIKYFHF
jgi:hypothetical protein